MKNKILIFISLVMLANVSCADQYLYLKANKAEIKKRALVSKKSVVRSIDEQLCLIEFMQMGKVDMNKFEKEYGVQFKQYIANGIFLFRVKEGKNCKLIKEEIDKDSNIKSIKNYQKYNFSIL